MRTSDHTFDDDILIFDAHCDTANVLTDQSDYFITKNKSHLAVQKIRKGGLNAQIFALWVNPLYSPFNPMKKAVSLYNALDKYIFSSPWAKKVTSTHEMERAIKNNTFACWISLEGGHTIENSPKNLDVLYSLGVRCMTLTHTKNTAWADSSGEPPRWDGLNKLGKEIVGRMERLGLIIDISHASDGTVEDVFNTTSIPIMASHSNVRTICDIPRNLPDDFIKEISERKGFIGVNFYPGFLKKSIYTQLITNLNKLQKNYRKSIKDKENDPDALHRAEMKVYSKMVEGIKTTDLNAVIDHILYIMDIGGSDCVGLGSDFDGIPLTPSNLTDVSCYPALIEGLSNNGLLMSDIRKIMGLNLFNFLNQF
jgi:membrane dipeptidase